MLINSRSPPTVTIKFSFLIINSISPFFFQSGPTDLRHFDPTLTCIPPSLSDLVTTDRSLHVEDFDYVAPEDVSAIKKYRNCPDTALKSEGEHTTTLEVTANSTPVKRANSTDEEKAYIQKTVGTTGTAGGSGQLTVPQGSEGHFVEGKLERSASGFASTEVLVVADVNPQQS